MKSLFGSLNSACSELPDCISQGEALALRALPRRVEGGEASMSLLLSILDASGFQEWQNQFTDKLAKEFNYLQRFCFLPNAKYP